MYGWTRTVVSGLRAEVRRLSTALSDLGQEDSSAGLLLCTCLQTEADVCLSTDFWDHKSILANR